MLKSGSTRHIVLYKVIIRSAGDWIFVTNLYGKLAGITAASIIESYVRSNASVKIITE